MLQSDTCFNTKTKQNKTKQKTKQNQINPQTNKQNKVSVFF